MERCWTTGTNNQWVEYYITGVDDEKMTYQVVFEDTGKTLRCTRSHLKPHGPDFPHISDKYWQQNPDPVPSQEAVLSKNPINLMTSVLETEPACHTETEEQRHKDHDNVPDTGMDAESNAADDSGTPNSGPDSSSTTGTKETIDMASSETSGSTSTSEGSTESDSAPSTPPSSRWTSTPCTEEAKTTALVPSGSPSPAPADNSLEMKQFYRQQIGYALTHSKFRK